MDEGLGLKIVNGFGNSYAEGDDIAGVVVKKGSRHRELGDLQDKTPPWSPEGSTPDHADSPSRTGRPEKLKFTDCSSGHGHPTERGNVDAIFVPEPFLSQALANPDNELLATLPGSVARPAHPGDLHLRQAHPEDPELVADFQAAMNDVLAPAQENEATRRLALLPDFSVSRQAAANMRVEEWDARSRPSSSTSCGSSPPARTTSTPPPRHLLPAVTR